MATFTLYDEFVLNVTSSGGGAITPASDTFKMALTDSAPNQATHTVLADVTEIGASNGYASGGNTLASASWTETAASSGIWQFSSSPVTFTASGGDIATHRYAVIYSSTASSGKLVGHIDRGASATITSGNSRTWSAGSSGWFQATRSP